MFSSFSRLIPTNVSISTPDFLKLNPGNAATSTSTTAASVPSKGAVLRKPTGPTNGKTVEADSQTSTTAENESANGDQRKDKAKKRKEAATETFIIVRPPPSMSNHPLNLQVQLMASSGAKERKQRSGSTSTTASNKDGTDAKPSNESRETLNDEFTGGSNLTRTTSVRSNRSDTESTYSASSNISTFSSAGGSTSSSSRRMIPLYNLHAHNVMTNVITDAGTDAKIAKFFKRGLEIMGLAMLEPVEVYGKYGWSDEGDTINPNIGNGAGSQVFRTISNLSRTISPVVPPGSGSALSNHNGTAELPTVLEVPSSPTTPKPGNERDTPKKLFGGLFNKKKKDPPTPLSLAPPSSATSANFPSDITPTSAKRKSNTPSVVVSSPAISGAMASTPTTASLPMGSEVVLQTQILGLQAVLQSTTIPPRGRPTTYVWVVKKWIKGSHEGLFDQIGGALGSSGLGQIISNTTGGGSGFSNTAGNGVTAIGGGAGAGGMEVEVRFEWKKGGKKGERRRKMATGSTIGGSTINDDGRSRRHSIAVEDKPLNSARLEPEPASSNKRLSFQGFGKKSPPADKDRPITNGNESNEHLGPSKYSRASSPNPPASVTTTGTTEDNHKRDDGGDDSDSDPEDSERPWNCYLHIRGVPLGLGYGSGNGHGSRNTSRSQSRDELSSHEEHGDGERERQKLLDIKLRVAALAPAPHHPKVVAQVKTPYPLPDVVFDSRPGGLGAMIRDRGDEKTDLDELGTKGEKGVLVLTAEEMKDVVSCTGLWLVVREGYGGLARKRKGDGWRLRG